MAIVYRTATQTETITTAVSWTLPTGHSADDLLLAAYGGKPYTATMATLTGYTAQGAGANGTSNSGNGTGSCYVKAWTKTHTGSESNPSGTLAAAGTPMLNGMLAAY